MRVPITQPPILWLVLCGLIVAHPAWAISVVLTSPTNSVVAGPATIAVSASATPGAGRRILRVDFFQRTTRIASDSSAPYGTVLTNVSVGTYIFTALAIDSGGAVAVSDPVVVRVDNPPAAKLTSPAANAAFAPGANITITASASDSDEIVKKVEFFANGNLIGMQLLAPYQIIWTNVASGRYLLTARATDLVGLTTTSSPIPIAVGSAPTVTITSPTNGTAFSATATITITATASDSDGSVASVEFFDGGRSVGTATVSPGSSTYSAGVSGLAVGPHTLVARAIDDQGFAASSDPVTIAVNAAGVQTYYIHTDHLNTPRAIANQTGTIVWGWSSGEPFGTFPPDDDPDNDGVSFVFEPRFTGQQFDRETGLAYNYFRDYDSGIGRYVQSDPIGLRGGIDSYAYVGGNPLTEMDPFGLLGNAPGGPSRPSPYCSSRPIVGCVPVPAPAEPAPPTCSEQCEMDFETCTELVNWYPFVTHVSGGLIGGGIGVGLGMARAVTIGVGTSVGGAIPKGVEGLTGMNQSTLNRGCEAGRKRCMARCPCEFL